MYSICSLLNWTIFATLVPLTARQPCVVYWNLSRWIRSWGFWNGSRLDHRSSLRIFNPLLSLFVFLEWVPSFQIRKSHPQGYQSCSSYSVFGLFSENIAPILHSNFQAIYLRQSCTTKWTLDKEKKLSIEYIHYNNILKYSFSAMKCLVQFWKILFSGLTWTLTMVSRSILTIPNAHTRNQSKLNSSIWRKVSTKKIFASLFLTFIMSRNLRIIIYILFKT